MPVCRPNRLVERTRNDVVVAIEDGDDALARHVLQIEQIEEGVRPNDRCDHVLNFVLAHERDQHRHRGSLDHGRIHHLPHDGRLRADGFARRSRAKLPRAAARLRARARSCTGGRASSTTTLSQLERRPSNSSASSRTPAKSPRTRRGLAARASRAAMVLLSSASAALMSASMVSSLTPSRRSRCSCALVMSSENDSIATGIRLATATRNTRRSSLPSPRRRNPPKKASIVFLLFERTPRDHKGSVKRPLSPACLLYGLVSASLPMKNAQSDRPV